MVAKTNEQNSRIKTCIEKTAVILFFIIASIFQGLYFFHQYLIANIVIMIYAGYIIYQKRDKLFLNRTVISLFVFSVLYIVSVLYGVNKEGALREALRVIAFTPVFMIGSLCHNHHKQWIDKGIIISGVIVSLLGLMALSGIFPIEGAVFDERVQSTFHYANTAAVYFMIGIILCLKYLSQVRSGEWRVVLNLCIYILTCGLVLTYSRGMWIIFSLFSLFILLSERLLDKDSKIRYLFLLALSAIVSLFLVSNSGEIRFTVVLLIGAITAILPEYLGMPFYMNSLKVLMVIGLAAINLVRNPVYSRITDIGFDVTEWAARMAYYKGALRLIADYPLFGAGAMGWAVLCEQYAADYVKYVHNYFLQVLTDVGLTGFASLMVFIISTLVRFARAKQKDWYYLIVILTILSHSLIDVDMHFQLISIIFFLYCGMICDRGRFETTEKVRFSRKKG